MTWADLRGVLGRDRLLPLFTPDDLDVARVRLETLQNAGLQAAELTARAPQAAGNFAALRRDFPDLWLGAGTVMDAATARTYLEAGAHFIVGPCWVPEVAAACRAAGMPYLPGAGTVREVFEAQRGGAEVVKLFPAGVLGSAFVRALRGPLPDAQLLVTGGVQPTVQSVGPWLEAGALAVGLGGSLFAQPAAEWAAALADLLAFTRAASR
ncbi:bifunctional 4-hydroxy-2-oxoglutarate aldolase/2-dehydro-3-deoxy-phosphogluconate aldolase [Deinococcus marmoris]|uniref:4-hydroxy-2-oxoglutarate aldolase n=1 Tax=Deinococcus marmoris TaxID=249408 RepID=A0A1U7NWP5_9DEIO|nr:bifunctional 4-hydroxy-2-oxoglutarate aldolase/2-dehydro-3-deoxy-phosphogluconate aldolase [Deinococcus marmoris]OLV17341.1 4-hydroxy-2-oxoglutarate aldolase [Deinococcus marmoris]